MTTAKFSNETKEKIYNRDNKCCIICGTNNNLQFHHIYYSNEKNIGKDRNNAEFGCTLCFNDHILAHGCKRGEGIRQECIKYCQSLYNN